LFVKLKAQIFDAGDSLEFEYNPNATTTGVDYRVVAKKRLQPFSDVFIVDHAWTTTIDKSHEQLRTIPHLLQRMARLVGIDNDVDVSSLDDEKKESFVHAVWRAMWRFNQTYNVNKPDGFQVTMWYVMDEVGSWMTHSDEPNFAAKPLFWLYSGIAYTIIWPIKPIAEEEAISRDYLPGVTKQRRERLMAFFNDERRGVLAQLIEEELKSSQSEATKQEVDVEPNEEQPQVITSDKPKGHRLPLKLFTPFKLIRTHLSRKEFVLEDNINLADIWWLYDRLK